MFTVLAILTFLFCFLLFLILIGKAGIMIYGGDHPALEFHICPACLTIHFLFWGVNIAWTKQTRENNRKFEKENS